MLPYLLMLLYLTKKNSPKQLRLLFITVLAAILAVFLADTTGGVLKNLIQRQRPCIVIQNTHLLVGCSTSGSMPSNHATNAFAYAVTLYLYARQFKMKWLTLYPLLLASLVALSRVVVGVHYPSDVLIGGIIGTMYAVVLHYLTVKIIPNCQ
ncbi:MAG: phosphatase PAP2 family protein [Thermodesulfovibrionales bacterium]|nr:phosphatase PAP2 family protein [Thermodesulfovibrionales bacterium]